MAVLKCLWVILYLPLSVQHPSAFIISTSILQTLLCVFSVPWDKNSDSCSLLNVLRCWGGFWWKAQSILVFCLFGFCFFVLSVPCSCCLGTLEDHGDETELSWSQPKAPCIELSSVYLSLVWSSVKKKKIVICVLCFETVSNVKTVRMFKVLKTRWFKFWCHLI